MKQKVRIEKKQSFVSKQKWFILIAFFLVALMVGSVLDVGRSNREKTSTYKNYEFTLTDSGWIAYDGNTPIMLSYNPQELESLTIPNINVGVMNYLEKAYLSFDPKDTAVQRAFFEFNRRFNLQTRVVRACYTDVEGCGDMPIKDCNSTTTNSGVIIFKTTNETKVALENNCLTVEGKDLTKIVDKIILNSL